VADVLTQLQAERLLRLQRLAAATAKGDAQPPLLRWVIMTSPFTHDATLDHFKQHSFFGLQESQVGAGQHFSWHCVLVIAIIGRLNAALNISCGAAPAPI
jgi:UDP-N-acetylglucosamine/UDP-N-acetylgalactosamine diphosphorylase